MRNVCTKLALVGGLLLAATAQGASLIGGLAFTVPTAELSATDAQQVELRLSIDAGSDPFSIDPLAVNHGIDLTNFPDWASITDARLDLAIGCGNTFASACVAGAPYAFGFNQAVLGLDKLTVGPGADWVFTLGAFTPTVGAVPAGSYKLFSATVGVQVAGQQWVLSLDAGGLPMFDDQGLPVYRLQSTSAYLPLFDTCGFAGDSAADCALPFTRTVTAAVPEPSAAGLLLLGIGVGCAARRRKSGVASH